MFGLFKKKETSDPVTDMIWMNAAAKQKGLLRLLSQKQEVVLCAWFDETVNRFTLFLEQEGILKDIYLPHQLPGAVVNDKPLIFLEHYPLYAKEHAYLNSIKPKEIIILSSLDEPLMAQFGSDRIIHVMQSLGLQENEPIAHNLITSSIRKAQMKFDKQAQIESSAHSMEEWFKRNVG